MSDANPAGNGGAGGTVAPAQSYVDLHRKLDEIIEESVRIPGQPAWIVICGYHIGETANFCAFSSEFVKTHGHGIVLIARNMHTHVVSMYAQNFLKIVSVPDDVMTALLYSSYLPPERFELDRPMSACWIDRGLRQYDGIRYLGRYAGRGGISETDLMRFVLRLPWNARMEAPRISAEWESQAWEVAKGAGLRVGRSVLLCPINNTAKKLPEVFWISVAARLKEQGYTVFTNMGGLTAANGLPTMPIAGTIPVDLSIGLVTSFAHFAGRIITGGNGMSFLAMLAGLKTFTMTQVFPGFGEIEERHQSSGERSPYPVKGADVMGAFQYLAPELCLDAPLNEFLVPLTAGQEELMRLGRVVADQEIDDPSCIRRLECNGKPYIEEHADWLSQLA